MCMLTKRFDIFGPFESLQNTVLIDAPGFDGDSSKQHLLDEALESADVVMLFMNRNLKQDRSLKIVEENG